MGSEKQQCIKIELKSAPTLSIVTLGEAKNYLKIDSNITEDDGLISDILTACTAFIEHQTNLCICQQEYIQYQEGGCKEIELVKFPLSGIPAVEYFGTFEATQSVNITVSDYFRIVGNTLYHIDGSWVRGRKGDGYKITYSAGLFNSSSYTSSNRPELKQFKTALLRLAAWAYENREEYSSEISELDFSQKYSKSLDNPTGITNFLKPLNNGYNYL